MSWYYGVELAVTAPSDRSCFPTNERVHRNEFGIVVCDICLPGPCLPPRTSLRAALSRVSGFVLCLGAAFSDEAVADRSNGTSPASLQEP